MSHYCKLLKIMSFNIEYYGAMNIIIVVLSAELEFYF